jgi:hypothetical protein
LQMKKWLQYAKTQSRTDFLNVKQTYATRILSG